MAGISKAEKSENFSDKEVKDKFFLTMLIEAVVADDRPAFYYISVWGNRLEELKMAMDKRMPFDLADYGHVLLSGYGHPTKEVFDYVEENFGLKHDDVPRLKMTPEGLQEVPLEGRENS